MKKKRMFLIIICLSLTCCGKASQKITASGTIESDEYDIFSEVSGKIIEIKKEEGDTIAAGETLAVIDGTDAELLIKRANANVKIAQAKLDEMTAGTRIELIEQSQANLKASQAKLNELKSGTRDEQIQQAEAAAREAKARLDDLKLGSRPEQLAQAQTQVEEAQSAVDNASSNFEYYKNNYSSIEALVNAGAASKQQLSDAQSLLNNASHGLDLAKNQLDIAISQRSLLENGATEKSIEAAQAQYEQAAAHAAYLKKGATPESIEAAQAAVEQNDAALAYLLNGSSKEQLDQASAQVESTQADLENAENQLAKYEIKSLVSGVLLYKNMNIGQLVNPGSNVFTVQVVDSRWVKIYLPQKYNGRIVLNDKVKIRASNLENEIIEGTIVWISPKAEFTPKNIETLEAKQENTVFAVKIKINDHLDALRPGMNAVVELEE